MIGWNSCRWSKNFVALSFWQTVVRKYMFLALYSKNFNLLCFDEFLFCFFSRLRKMWWSSDRKRKFRKPAATHLPRPPMSNCPRRHLWRWPRRWGHCWWSKFFILFLDFYFLILFIYFFWKTLGRRGWEKSRWGRIVKTERVLGPSQKLHSVPKGKRTKTQRQVQKHIPLKYFSTYCVLTCYFCFLREKLRSI